MQTREFIETQKNIDQLRKHIENPELVEKSVGKVTNDVNPPEIKSAEIISGKEHFKDSTQKPKTESFAEAPSIFEPKAKSEIISIVPSIVPKKLIHIKHSGDASVIETEKLDILPTLLITPFGTDEILTTDLDFADAEPAESIFEPSKTIDIATIDEIEPNHNSELPNYELLKISLPFIEFGQYETINSDEITHQMTDSPTVAEQISAYIETLEPEKATEANAILEMIIDKIQLISTIESETEQNILEEELELICERLLVCIGVEPTPEVVKNLLLAFKIEILEQKASSKEFDYDEGTHERKNNVFQLLQDIPEASYELAIELGKRTLQLAS